MPDEAAPVTAAAASLDVLDPFAPEHRADPYPLYHRLRGHAPVWFCRRRRRWVVTGYDAATAVLRDPRFSSQLVSRPGDGGGVRASLRSNVEILLYTDPPEHTRLRRLVAAPFTPAAVRRLQPRIEGIAAGLLDRLADSRVADVMASVAFPLPVTVICELLGVPAEDRHALHPWSSAASRLVDGGVEPTAVEEGMVGAMSLLNYFNALIEERRRSPRDDLLSALVAARYGDDGLGDDELRIMVLMLFIAGHETTMNLIGNGLHSLLRHPDQLLRLQEEPQRVPRAVEELLRIDSPVHLAARTATEDVPAGEGVIGAGDDVLVVLGAANRDPARFPDPDRLDIGRADNPHLAFSAGAHFCLGSALARLQGEVLFGQLVRRFPVIELAAEPAWRDHLVLRGLRDLRVSVRT